MTGVPALRPGHDLCDRCGVHAWFRVCIQDTLTHTSWLDFCLHHFRVHELAFMVRGYTVDDQSVHINGG